MNAIRLLFSIGIFLSLASIAADNKLDERANRLIVILDEMPIPEYVENLAQTAHKKYQDRDNPLSTARLEAKKINKVQGGRKKGWINQTFGQDESAIIALLQELPVPETFSLAEIHRAFELVTGSIKPDPDSPAKVWVVEGVGINYLYDRKELVEGGFSQLASQFNWLESNKKNYKITVAKYLSDRTQGPQGSIEAAAAALHRRAAENSEKLQHALTDLLPQKDPPYYKNGYLNIEQIEDHEKLYQYLEKNIDDLRILAQPILTEASGTKCIQVFAAAPNNNDKYIGKDEARYKIISLLVKAQYRAIAELAVIRAIKAKQNIPLHLTTVGQGVFNNPKGIMEDALGEVDKVLSGFGGVTLYIHGYYFQDSQLIESALKKIGCKYEKMSEEQFFNTDQE